MEHGKQVEMRYEMKTMFIILGIMLVVAFLLYCVENAFDKKMARRKAAIEAERLRPEAERLAAMDKLNASFSNGEITRNVYNRQLAELMKQNNNDK